MLMMTARMGLDAGMRSMISRAVGARHVSRANHVMLQALTLSLAYSIVLVVIGMILTEPLLRLLGIGDEVVRQAAGYMRFQFIAMSMMGLQRLTAGGLQASGDSITPLKAASVSRILHLILSPFLIFGWWWFPTLELAGAGAANLIAQTIGMGMNMSALIRGTSRLRLSLRGYYVDYPMIWSILKIGIRASVTGAQRAISQLIVVFMVAPFGAGALAALRCLDGPKIPSITPAEEWDALPAHCGTESRSWLYRKARQSLIWALIYAGGARSWSRRLLAFPGPIAGFFNSDPEFVARASTWLQILAVGYLSMNAVQVYTQGFNTTGDTFAPMVIMLSTMWLVELPLVFALSQYTGLAEYGVPWAIVIGMTLRAAAYTVPFFRGPAANRTYVGKSNGSGRYLARSRFEYRHGMVKTLLNTWLQTSEINLNYLGGRMGPAFPPRLVRDCAAGVQWIELSSLSRADF